MNTLEDRTGRQEAFSLSPAERGDLAVTVQVAWIPPVGMSPGNGRWSSSAQKCPFCLQKATHFLSRMMRSLAPGLLLGGSLTESRMVQIAIETPRYSLDLSGTFPPPLACSSVRGQRAGV